MYVCAYICMCMFAYVYLCVCINSLKLFDSLFLAKNIYIFPNLYCPDGRKFHPGIPRNTSHSQIPGTASVAPFLGRLQLPHSHWDLSGQAAFPARGPQVVTGWSLHSQCGPEGSWPYLPSPRFPRACSRSWDSVTRDPFPQQPLEATHLWGPISKQKTSSPLPSGLQTTNHCPLTTLGAAQTSLLPMLLK